MGFKVIHGKLTRTVSKVSPWEVKAKPVLPKQDLSTKGHYMGLCNRSACLAPKPTWWNTGSYAYYCGDCAFDINYYGCRKFNEPEICHKVTGFNEDGTPQFDPLAKKDYYDDFDE